MGGNREVYDSHGREQREVRITWREQGEVRITWEGTERGKNHMGGNRER